MAKKNQQQEPHNAKQSSHNQKNIKKNQQQKYNNQQQEPHNLKTKNKNQKQKIQPSIKNSSNNSTTKKGCFNRGNSDILKNLTPSEIEVLNYLSIDFLTESQIALKRKCSQQAVNRIVQRLREKGIINAVNKVVVKSRPTPQPTHAIRLHAQEFNIKIIHKDERYISRLKKSNNLFIDGNRVLLYKNSIEVYATQMFFGESAQSATSKSFVYWNYFFTKLENDLKIIIIKDRYQNIKLVNAHYAEIHNEFAKDCNINAEKIKITTTEDGKLWFLIDNSFNLHEAETVHPQTAKPDIENVTRFFNDIRDKNPPTNSEVMLLLTESLKINKETAAGLNTVVQTLNMMMQQPQNPQPIKEREEPWYVG